MGTSTKPLRVTPLATGAVLVGIALGLGLARRIAPEPHAPVASAGRTNARLHPPGVSTVTDERTMRSAQAEAPRRQRSRIGSLVMALAVALGIVGVGLVGVALASQRSASAPQKDVATATKFVVARNVEGWQPRLPRAVAAKPTVDVPPTPPPPPVTKPVVSAAKPVALQIPAIDVRSPVHALGQADDGALESPAPGPRYNHAAWYRYSPTPGSLGPAILLGHVDSAAEGPSVFFRLGELRAGDKVSVTRADDSVGVFRVDRVRRYAKTDFPTDLVYGNIDHAGLRIITCGGAFDNATGHYLDNVVVFASLVR